jgi:hypothetical protein
LPSQLNVSSFGPLTRAAAVAIAYSLPAFLSLLRRDDARRRGLCKG